MSNVLHSSLKRILLGLVFIVSGILFGLLSDYSDEIVEKLCGPGQLPLWCIPIRLALIDFGLKGISYTLIVIGVILTVLYSYVAELLGYILSFALTHVTNSKNVVVDAMGRGTVSRDDSADIVTQVMSRYMGYYDKNSHSFSNFLVDKFMCQTDKDGGFWRRDYYTIIRVAEMSVEEVSKFGTRYLKWSEITSFTVENVKLDSIYPYKSQSTVKIFEEKDKDSIIDELRYEVRAGGVLIFSFDDHKDSVKAHNFENGDYSSGVLTVSINEGDISIKVEKEVTVNHGSVDFVVDEESLISRDDPTYELTLTHPTKRLTFRFNLPEGFEIIHHGCSGRKFGSSISDKVVRSQPGKNRVRLDVYDWCLPGIATVLAWKPSEH